MILNFDRGYGQTTEQMIQSLMESTQMALDTMERKLSQAGIDISSDGGSNSLLDMVYPIGAIYISVSDVSPETFLGGTWEQIKDSFILAAGDTYEAGSSGGSADAIIPYHNHSVDAVSIASSGAHTNHTMKGYGAVLGSGSTGWRFGSGGGDTANNIIQGGAHTHSVPAHNTNYAGASGNTTGANMPPYLTAYMWKRTA